MKKNMIALLLCLCLLAGLCGCSLISDYLGGYDEEIDAREPQHSRKETAPTADDTEATTDTAEPPATDAVETDAPVTEVFTSEHPAYDNFLTHSYMIFRENCTWEEARDYCITMGGHLVTITSAEEEEMIVQMVKDADAKYIWIGGFTQKTASGEIVGCWVTGEPMDYEAWLGPYEPTGADMDGTPESSMLLWYIEKYSGWGWNDTRNDLSGFSAYTDKLYYICEFDDNLKDVSAR